MKHKKGQLIIASKNGPKGKVSYRVEYLKPNTGIFGPSIYGCYRLLVSEGKRVDSKPSSVGCFPLDEYKFTKSKAKSL